MRRKIFYLLLVLLTTCSLCACSLQNSAVPTESTAKKITLAIDAIDTVKADKLDQDIARSFGLRKYMKPQYGSDTATQNSDGSWTVTIKGNISGYTDEYLTNYRDCKFEVLATVSENGEIREQTVRIVK